MHDHAERTAKWFSDLALFRFSYLGSDVESGIGFALNWYLLQALHPIFANSMSCWVFTSMIVVGRSFARCSNSNGLGIVASGGLYGLHLHSSSIEGVLGSPGW